MEEEVLSIGLDGTCRYIFHSGIISPYLAAQESFAKRNRQTVQEEGSHGEFFLPEYRVALSSKEVDVTDMKACLCKEQLIAGGFLCSVAAAEGGRACCSPSWHCIALLQAIEITLQNKIYKVQVSIIQSCIWAITPSFLHFHYEVHFISALDRSSIFAN